MGTKDHGPVEDLRPASVGHRDLDLAETKQWRRFVPAWLRALLWADSATRYDAFLSYSWKGDGAVAPVIQSLLQGFLRPWYAVRAKTVFRDLSCLPAGSSLELELFDRLNRSDHLIVLACPEAAQSGGMEKEAAHWFSRPRAGQVLIIVTAGTCRTWDQIREQLLPPSMRANLIEEPLFVFLQDRRDQILRDPKSVHKELIEDLKQIFLRLYPGRDWGQLHGEERRNRRIALGLIGAVLVTLATLSVLARSQQRLADQRNRVARSRALAIQSREARALPDTALLLSLAAIHAGQTLDAQSALLGTLFTYPRLESSLYAWHSAANRVVQAFAVSPGGDAIVAGYRDSGLIVWDGTDPAGFYLSRPRTDSSSGIDALAFSADGIYLAAAIADGTISTWSVKDRRLLPRIRLTDAQGQSEHFNSSPYARAEALAFNPATGLLAAGQDDGRIRLWNVVTASPAGSEFGDPIPAEMNGHVIGVQALAFSGDGAFLVSGHGGSIQGTDGVIRVWRAADGYRPGRVVKTGTNGVRALAVHRARNWLAYQTSTAMIRIEDIDGTEQWSLRGRDGDLPTDGGVTSLAFAVSDDALSAAFSNGNIGLWRDLATKDEEAAFGDVFPSGHSQDVAGVSFVTGKNLLATAGSDGIVRLWHTGREPLGLPFGNTSPLYSAAFNGPGTLLASVGVNGTLEWWDVQRRAKLRELPLGNSEKGAAVSFVDELSVDVLTYSGRLLRCTQQACATVARTGRIEQSQSRLFGPQAGFWFEWLSDRPYRCTVAGCEGLPGPGASGHEPNAASPDGLRWTVRSSGAGDTPGGGASFCDRNGCRALDLGSVGSSSWVGGMTFSPTGALLVVGTDDGRVVFFDGRSGARLAPPLAAQKGAVEHFAFSADDRLMVSGGRGGTVLLWDVMSRQPLGTPIPRPRLDQVRALIFHPKKLIVLIQYSSGHITELSVDLAGYWQERACRAAGRDEATLEWARFGSGLPYESVCGSSIKPTISWEPRPPSSH